MPIFGSHFARSAGGVDHPRIPSGCDSGIEAAMRFLFMDEKYAVSEHPPRLQVTSLTGVLIPQPVYRAFRERFYRLIAAAIDDPENTISTWPHEQLRFAALWSSFAPPFSVEVSA